LLRALNGLFLQISARNKALLSLNKSLETQVTIRTRELTITNRHLEELAKTLLHGFRSDDVVCRLGGDEFLVICPDTDSAGGFHIANQVLQTVAPLQAPTEPQTWSITKT